MRPGPTLDDNLFTSMTTFSPMDVTFGKAARSGEHHLRRAAIRLGSHEGHPDRRRLARSGSENGRLEEDEAVGARSFLPPDRIRRQGYDGDGKRWASRCVSAGHTTGSWPGTSS